MSKIILAVVSLAVVLGWCEAAAAAGPQVRRVNTLTFRWNNSSGNSSNNAGQRDQTGSNSQTPAASVTELISRAYSALRNQDLFTAASLLRQARGQAGKNYQAQLDDLAKQIEAAAQEKLTQADKLAENRDAKGARQIYEQLVQLGLPISATARQRLSALNAAAGGADAAGVVGAAPAGPADKLTESIANALQRQRQKLQPPAGVVKFTAEEAPPAEQPGDAQVIKSMPMEQQADLLGKMRILVRSHQDSAGAEQYRALLDELENDDQLAQNIQRFQDEQSAQKKYELAENYKAYRLTGRAADCYREILAAYPQTDIAQKARLQLIAITQQQKL